MFEKLKDRFSALTLIKKVGVALASIFVVGVVATAASGNNPQKDPVIDIKGASTSQQQNQQSNIETKTITELIDIPFEKATVQDSTRSAGTSTITQIGVNGKKSQIWEVVYKDGIVNTRILVSETVTLAPIAEVTAIGTKVSTAAPLNCPNGTYINSAGNTVCSPYSSPSVPEGATAQCRDGSYSFSQSRSGTCSHHGGVATWL